MNNRIESWIYWKQNPRTYSRLNDVCSICDGAEEVTVIGDWVVDCKCAIDRWEASIKETLDPLRSGADPADFNMEPVAVAGQQLEDAIAMSMAFVESPSGIFILSGSYGVGKSHLLRAINTELSPIALYLTMSDFEWSCFRALESQKLHVYTDIIAHAPILLLDDYGMEYGAEIIEAQVVHIIDSRVRQMEYYPLVVATNKSGKELSLEGRVGSRLMNAEKDHMYAKMGGLLDYRTRKIRNERI